MRAAVLGMLALMLAVEGEAFYTTVHGKVEHPDHHVDGFTLHSAWAINRHGQVVRHIVPPNKAAARRAKTQAVKPPTHPSTLLKLNVLTMPRFETPFVDAVIGPQYQPIMDNGDGIFAPVNGTRVQELEGMQAKYDELAKEIDLSLLNPAGMGTEVIPNNPTSWFGVYAKEYRRPGARVLTFRGSYGRGDLGNALNHGMKWVLEKGSERLKDAWVREAGLEWTAEMEARAQSPIAKVLEAELTQKKSYLDSIALFRSLMSGIYKGMTPEQKPFFAHLSDSQKMVLGYLPLLNATVLRFLQGAEAAKTVPFLSGYSQGGTMAAMGAMIVRQLFKKDIPAITFASAGSSCLVRYLENPDQNYLAWVNPYGEYQMIRDYSHPLDPWGNAMGLDVGTKCLYTTEKGAKIPMNQTRAYRYCKDVYGYPLGALIAAFLSGNTSVPLYSAFARCRYVTHDIYAIYQDLGPQLENAADNATFVTSDGGCSPVVIPEGDSRCPMGVPPPPQPTIRDKSTMHVVTPQEPDDLWEDGGRTAVIVICAVLGSLILFGLGYVIYSVATGSSGTTEPADEKKEEADA